MYITSYRTDGTKEYHFGIVHDEAEPETMVSSFKLLSRLSAYPGFVPERGIYREKNLKLLGFHQIHCCTDRSNIVHHARQCRS